MVTHEDLVVKSLGPCRVDSPLLPLLEQRKRSYYNVDESDRVLFDDTASALIARGVPADQVPGFEPAGPRRRIFFDPSKTRAGIVTCGGLCPGFNDVIRALVMELHFAYGVHRIHGFCNGYQGFIPKYKRPVLELTSQYVSRINELGGTILGTSRGEQDPAEIVDCLERMGINVLFVIGGDGTLRGAQAICREVEARNAKIAVVGIPKTIDNDIMYIDQSFGFQTAFSVAADVIRTAHAEAKASPNGVGLVKLMGRHSGLIACYASLAHNDANFVLIPEVPFALDGERGFLEVLKSRVRSFGHAVVVVAEGAGQDLMGGHGGQADASGNAKLGDVGVFLKDKIAESFAASRLELNLKYFDPSYMVRSVKANPFDAVFCLRLAHNAVHAAMAGRTEVVVSRWHGRFVLLPIPLAVRDRHVVDPNGDLWLSVLESTGQPPVFG
ncbi:MAG: ATP-dependent 6-phosphofructokinase [Paludisphaera borealis]|uniref:ATP-dependent 6-phosphofructokinase n=1 Tax=Paludisphaera borealis TaxID=1387353 RepID=UPI002841D4E4|nr:ATP-dependent 6-phosphofructokinase [Paludisphaera borealis]MDR3623419.1 ATP-dependent 6-phosphofructokinase [Paludisphaera borealis]